MPISITLRRELKSSPFRRQLHRICSAPGGAELVLCSGYIYEPNSGYSILDDQLGSVLKAGLGKNRLMTVAGKLGKGGYINWLACYRNFVLRAKNLGINIDAFIAPKRNWHAKIAIRLDVGGVPLAGMVGSSNLTGPAYREHNGNWNYECDVTLWRPSTTLDGHFRAAEDADAPFESMAVTLDPNVEQPDEMQRLNVLYADVRRDLGEMVRLDEYE